MTSTSLQIRRILGKPLVLCAILVIIPLAVTLIWGPAGIGDSAYTAFYRAEALAHGGRPALAETLRRDHLLSPLWMAFLTAAAVVAAPLSHVALVSGALGWGLACVAVYGVGRGVRLRAAGTVAALLLASSPFVVAPTVLATELPWLLCLAWGAAWCTVRGYWRSQTVALALLLALHVTPLTLVWTLALLVERLRSGDRFPWVDRFLLAGVLAVWVLLMSLRIVADPFGRTYVATWLERITDLLAESDFYWFGIPFIAAGLALSLWRGHRRWTVLLLGLALLLSDPATNGVLAYSAALFLTGAGVEVLADWLLQRELLALPRHMYVGAVALVAVSLLVVAQTGSLVQSRPISPDHHQALLFEAVAWVRERTTQEDRILGSSQVGYLAQRPTVLYEGKVRNTAQLSALVPELRISPPAACISYRSLAWDDLERTGWFRNTYYEAAAFTSEYDPLSPVKVWMRVPTALDLGDYRSLSVRLPDGSRWIGDIYTPDRITPGQPLSVTLFIYTPPTAAMPVAGAGGQSTTVYLRSPGAGASFAHSDLPVDRDLRIDEPEIGSVWAETYVVETPGDLSMGAYYLSASLRDRNSDSYAHIYQDETTFPIDRVTLGYVVVPWRGELSAITPVGATLGAGEAGERRFTLLGYETEGELVPGGAVNIVLYWEAQEPLEDLTADHFVFVHLLNSDGQLVAQHDGPPVSGAYPLAAWIPGEPVQDTHTLFLDPALPPGTYTLQTGVYTWPTFERLPAWDTNGARLQDDVIRLGTVTIK